MIWQKCCLWLCGLLAACLLLSASAEAVAAGTGSGAKPAAGLGVNEPQRILFVVSNQRFYGNSTLPASISFGEVVHAWDIFTGAGYPVDFVSPDGGAVPIDPGMLGPKLTARLQDQRLMAGLQHSKTPAQIDASLYSAVYYVGGSNAMYQVPDNKALQTIARHIYENNRGVISAVCHGTAGIVWITLSDGSNLLAGKRVTGYPEEYEEPGEAYFRHLPFPMRKTIEAQGGLFKAPHPEQPYIEVDGRLVTGQNYPSAPLVARAVVGLLQQMPAKSTLLSQLEKD